MEAGIVLLVLRGWLVLRLTWEQVMHEQAYVRRVLDLVRCVEHQKSCPKVDRLARPAARRRLPVVRHAGHADHGAS